MKKTLFYFTNSLILINNMSERSRGNICHFKDKVFILNDRIKSYSTNVDLIKKDKFYIDLIKNGFRGYNLYKNLGALMNLQNLKILKQNIKDLLVKLDADKTYTVLSIIRYFDSDTGLTKGYTLSDSFKVNNDSDVNLICDKLQIDMNVVKLKYDLYDDNSELILISREWLNNKEFNVIKGVITDRLDEIIKDSINLGRDEKKDLDIKTRINENLIGKYKDILMNMYGDEINLVKFKMKKVEVIKYYKNDSTILQVKVVDNINYVTVRTVKDGKINLNSPILIEWIDKKMDDNSFYREIGNVIYYYKNDEVEKIEVKYNFPNIRCELPDIDYDDKLGVIDFETFGSKDNGIGHHFAYAGGWGNELQFKLFYIKENEKSEDFILRVIENIFEYKENNKRTFYAHNLGRFDSILLLKGLIGNENYKVKGMWKDNCLISLQVKDLKKNMTIKFYDSLLLLKENLRTILKNLNCSNEKDIFPYRFMRMNNLFYIGNKPEFKYYDNISINDYNNIPDKDWNVKDQCLNYLEKDLKGLLEVLSKFSKAYYDKYSLNITKYKSLPGISLALFTSRFYDEDYKIKMIKGFVEKDIRTAYFGGNVDVFHHKIKKVAYMYDINSQYPAAMLEDMPIGNPILTNETDINNFFGFAYGEITPPSKKVLQNLYIQKRNDDGSIFCPREKFTRLIFSEEIKYAMNEGYQFQMFWGYKFERGKGVFNDYVKDLYFEKKNSNNPVYKKIAKYSLNSVYGKFGQKDTSSNIKIMKVDEVNKFLKNYNYKYISELNNNYVIIKYSSRINEKLRNLYNIDDLNKKDLDKLGLYKLRGVPSAVQIAAAISSYARIEINKYKNMKDNFCYYSDTDSVILENKLQNSFVGTDLGQMKLEYIINEGILIRAKLYALKTLEKGIIIKSSGVESKYLVYKDFKNLLLGNNVEILCKSFHVDWKNLNINMLDNKIILKGIKSN